MDKYEQQYMQELIVKGLKDTMKDHGPITTDLLTSAAKRVSGRLREGHVNLPSSVYENDLAQSKIKIKELQEKVMMLKKDNRYYIRCLEGGVPYHEKAPSN